MPYLYPLYQMQHIFLTVILLLFYLNPFEKQFLIQDDHNIRVYNVNLAVSNIVGIFVEKGLEVFEAHTCEDSLEDHFKRITGGKGIA